MWPAETKYKTNHPIGHSKYTRSETIFIELDLEILEVGHLVAHSGDKLAVQFRRFFGDLKLVDIGRHCFEGVKGKKGLPESFGLSRGHRFSSQPNILGPHLRPDYRDIVFVLVGIVHYTPPFAQASGDYTRR